MNNQPLTITFPPPHQDTISSHTPLWLCMQKNTWRFIALSCILQAAKDILYWKGNASSLQTVSIRQYRLCTDIESSAGCCVTVLDCSNLFLLFDSIDEQQSSIEFSAWLVKPTRNILPLIFIDDPLVVSDLSAVCCWWQAVFHIHRHREMKWFGLNTALIAHSLVWFASS